MILNSPYISGSLTVTGNIIASGSITLSGSVASASFATNASTASFVALAQSASNAVLAQTASSADNLLVRNILTAQTLVVQTITSSVDFVTGSTRFGSISGNTHQFTGSVGITGSLTGVGATFSGQVDGTIFNSTSNAFRFSGNNAISLVSLNAQNVVKINAAGYWGTQLVGANDQGILINNVGNVGIRTTSPDAGLTIETDFTAFNALAVRSSNAFSTTPETSVAFRTKYNTAGAYSTNGLIVGFKNNATDGDQQGGLQFWTNAGSGVAEKMRITSGGNVLIGTTTGDGYKLQIVGASQATVTFGQTFAGVAAYSQWVNSSGAFVMGLDGAAGTTERMRITSAGVIQLGNTSYSPYLTFRTGGSTAYAGVINTDSKNDYLTINGGNSTGYGSGANIGLVGSDRYGTATAGQLELSAGSGANNTSYGYIAFYTANTLRMQISFNGAIGTTAGGTNIYNPSDIRLKRNIVEVPYGLNEILNLKPSKFNWREKFSAAEEDKDMLGFIAQEIQTVIPEAVESFGQNVHVNADNIEYTVENPLRVNEKFIIPVLVKAIQELKVQNDDLQSQINELKAQ